MVKFVALVWHRHCVDDLRVARRARLDIDDGERIRLREVRAEQHGVSEVLWRRFHRQFRRCMKGRVGPKIHHDASLFRVGGRPLAVGVFGYGRHAPLDTSDEWL